MNHRVSILLFGLLFLIVLFLGAVYLTRDVRNPTLPASLVQTGSVTLEAEVADTNLTRMRGLSGREDLREQKAMLFIFPYAAKHGFWMNSMKFPIDIIWIEGGRVVGVTEHVLPEPAKSLAALTIHYPPEPVTYVLEVRAGTVRAHDIKVGDPFSFSRQ